MLGLKRKDAPERIEEQQLKQAKIEETDKVEVWKTSA